MTIHFKIERKLFLLTTNSLPFLVMFCSKSCMTTAESFHHFECQTIHVNPEQENNIFEFAHRAVFEALGIFKKIEKLQRFVEDFSQVKTVFDFDFSKGDEKLTQKNLLQAVTSLQRNPMPKNLLLLMADHVKLMKSITKNPKHQKFLDEFMRKQMEILITNTFGMTDCDGEIVGSGTFPLSSLFNHSCAPNVVRVTVEDKLVFVTSKPVEINQQLFVCYRSNFLASNKEKRQREIFKSYRFNCSCEACTNNFPTSEKLPKTDESFELPEFDTIFDEFKFNCIYIDENIKQFPNSEIATLISRNQTILESIANIAQLTT